jgi:hypothetical protein
MTPAKIITVSFMLPIEDPVDDADIEAYTAQKAAKILQDWYDETGGFGGNFVVTRCTTTPDQQWWWDQVWNAGLPRGEEPTNAEPA